ncbi:MAG: hypothetical protein D6730_19960 [Bacteroidetes bacterium]|nr:MAG: hypothetical protein D6730_19960 [Bacteroidota bacterium]
MSAQKRNFWILLTLIGLIFALRQWVSDVTQNRCAGESTRLEVDRKTCSSHLYKYSQSSWQTTPGLYEYIQVDRLPIPVNKYRVIREIQNHKNLQQIAGGRVLARVLVSPQGRYRAHQILESNNPELAKVCEAYIHHLRFRPARKNGSSLSYWINVPLYIP